MPFTITDDLLLRMKELKTQLSAIYDARSARCHQDPSSFVFTIDELHVLSTLRPLQQSPFTEDINSQIMSVTKKACSFLPGQQRSSTDSQLAEIISQLIYDLELAFERRRISLLIAAWDRFYDSTNAAQLEEMYSSHPDVAGALRALEQAFEAIR